MNISFTLLDFRNPTPSQILGLHFDVAKPGQLRYLNINTTFNSSILLNYRQTESAFWSIYLPTVIGRLVPTYPPVTEVRILYIFFFIYKFIRNKEILLFIFSLIILIITVLVGTKTTIANCFLVSFHCLSVINRAFRSMLYALAQCQKVRKGKQNQPHDSIFTLIMHDG